MPWVACRVTMAGPAENGIVYVALLADDNSFHRWFVAVPNMRNEMLATALTAISARKNVSAYITDVAEYSTINRLYVLN